MLLGIGEKPPKRDAPTMVKNKKLQDARIQRGFETATDAAKAMGVPVQTYISHENGDRNPRPAAAKKYAEFFNVDYSWLISDDEDALESYSTKSREPEIKEKSPAQNIGYSGQLWEEAKKEARKREELLTSGGYLPFEDFSKLLMDTYEQMALRRSAR